VYALRDREGNVSSSSIQGREGLEYPWGRVELSLSFLPISHLQPSGAGLLKVTLIRGTSLLAADRNGQSDPFVMFTLGASPAQKSRVLKKTVNPVWNSKQDDFLWTVTSKQLCSDWSLHVQCLDYDMMGSNESLGHLSLDIGLLLGKGWLGRASRRKGGGEAHGEFALRNDGKISASALKRRGGPELESLGLGTLELSLSYTVQG
jgi:Ca2+-dependent lipid-binding protein